jgi:hypothetical protein
MDLMYLSTLDLPGSLISESRTSASSSSQVSMTLSTCTLPIHRQPVYCTHPVHRQLTYTHPIHRQPAYAPENRVFLYSHNSREFPSTLHATSDVHHFRCIHKYLQEYLHKKIDIQYVQVCVL